MMSNEEPCRIYSIDRKRRTLAGGYRRKTLQEGLAQRPKLRARISATEYGAIIQLSDGRRLSVSRASVPPLYGSVIDAAVDWARRNGAVFIDISDG